MATAGVLEYLIQIKDEGMDSKLSRTESKIKSFSNKLSMRTVAIGTMIGQFATKMVTATASMMKSTVKSAIQSYADYEQLVGGIDTLFKESSKKMQQYAAKAYKTVGISANQYMETVTSFSASLLQSLGNDTEKAADIADMAMIDMADNVNKMGSSMESVENAYKGFAKQNYTMLDNLKLGYGGTRTEMERLLKDAEKLTKKKYDIKNLSDVYEAIHAIQVEMGIAGTTQKEAMDTVSGSFNAAKAAWQDVLTAIGRGKDIKKTVRQFAETAKTALKNVKPVFKASIQGLFSTVKELLPDLGDIFTELKKELKDSDIPLLRILGDALDKVGLIAQGITNLATDWDGTVAEMQKSDDPFTKFAGGALQTFKTLFDDVMGLFTDWDTTVERMKTSDDPFERFAGGALDTIKETFDWIVEKTGSVENAIKTIAGAFALIQIAPGVLSFVSSLLLISKNSGLISKMFGGGQSYTNSGTQTVGTGMSSSGATSGVNGIKFKWEDIKRNIINKTNGFNLTNSAFVSDYLQNVNPLTASAVNTVKKALGIEPNNGFGDLPEYIGKKTEEIATNAKNFDKDLKENKLTGWAVKLGENAIKFWDNFWKGTAPKTGKDVLNTLTGGFLFGTGNEKDNFLDENEQLIHDDLMKTMKDMEPVPVKTELDPDDSKIKDILNKPHQTTVTLIPVVGGGGDGGGTGGTATGGGSLGVSGGGWAYGKGFDYAFGNAKGNWDVPYDNYPALLHRGEMVLNKSQARQFRDGEGGYGSSSLGEMVNASIEKAMSRVYVMLNGNKVGDLTSKRVKNNINATTYNKLRAMGG